MTQENNLIYTQMRNAFYKKFKEHCTPILKNLEKQRLLALRIFISITVTVLLTILGFIIHTLITQQSITISQETIILALVVVILFWQGFSFYSKFFEKNIKKQIMPILCKCFDNLQWIENPVVDHSLFQASRIIREHYNEVHVDDVFVGTHKDVSIQISEVEYIEIKITRGRDGKIERKKRTIFDGVITTLEMNKNFSSHTLVTSDSLFKSSGGFNLKHTTLEDVLFEKKFDVYTNDEVEARYLLTTSFMERLTDLKKSYGSTAISCAFYQNKLIIAMDLKRDMFKLGSIFKETTDERMFMQLYREIEALLRLIDHFKLDQKIGL